jgi:precorrin-6B methylase 2
MRSHAIRLFALIAAMILASTADQGLAARRQPSASESTADNPLPSTAPKTKKEPRPSRYQFHSKHDPDGIGKFYLGREIAHVMGYGGISWLERPERDSEEHLSQLVDSLKLLPGMVVADIGAGSGVITFRMAEKVGPMGKVLAVDVQDEMLSVLSKRAKQLKIANVKTVRGTEKSPNLRPSTLDLAIMVDVYHEFRYPYEMVLEISKALKPGGRFVLVEYRKEDPSVPIKLVHKMTETQAKREIDPPEFGLRWRETIEALPWQHIIIFERQPTAERRSP